MHQFVLFEIVREEEAAIAESIASHLAASYCAYGGFNFDQAGVTASKVWSSGLNWKTVAELALDSGYFLNLEANLQDWEINQSSRKAATKVCLVRLAVNPMSADEV